MLQLGRFHTSLAFLAVIGKRFADAGLTKIFVESGVLGVNAVNGVISGKHYNRAVRTHKTVMEAMYRILWKLFEEWLLKQAIANVMLTDNLLSALEAVRSNTSLYCFNGLQRIHKFRLCLIVSARFVLRWSRQLLNCGFRTPK